VRPDGGGASTSAAAKAAGGKGAAGGGGGGDSYWVKSTRPLHVLVFLLPLVLAYELGSLLYLNDHGSGPELSVSAYKLFVDLFHAFRLAGASLPSLALLVVFLTWHVMSKDPWKLDANVLAAMFLESLAWTLPLLVLAATFVHARSSGLIGGGVLAAVDVASPAGHVSAMKLLTIAVGAGLYEEMLFRLVGIALFHFILVDLIGMKERWGQAVAIVIVALAFSAYHHDQNMAEFAFKVLAGVYFGTVYSMRGFGIVVATHAVYDVLVLVVLQGH
jgi:membrane protease YdiL (CAAX protease family)